MTVFEMRVVHFRFRLCDLLGTNQSYRLRPKLLSFASFSHSLRNIQSIYSQNIMYIQSRTIRAKMPDESTRERRVLRFRSPTRPKENLCRTQPLAVWASAHARNERHRRPTAAEHSFGSSLFKRVTQTVRDYLLSGRFPNSLRGMQTSAGYRMRMRTLTGCCRKVQNE